MDGCVAGTEAKAVQSLLVSRRVARADPTPFVRVLRMVFDDACGQFRMLSCPTFGLYEDLVAHLCSGEFQFSRAVSRFAVRGRFIFAGMPPGSREKLERELLAQMAAVRSGSGDDIVAAVMLWTRTVRLRALQDIALDHPATFERMWMARSGEDWDEVSQDWRVALSTREDRDLGYLPGLWSRPCGDALAKKRASILMMVEEIGAAMAMEDEGRWLEADMGPRSSIFQCRGAGKGLSVSPRGPRAEVPVNSYADEGPRRGDSVPPADPGPVKSRDRTVLGQLTTPTIQRTSSAREPVVGDGSGRALQRSIVSAAPKKKLLILDLNGLLLAAIHKSGPQIGMVAHKIVGNFNVYIRPGCEDFVKFCLRNFEVAVWSSGMVDKVSGLVDAAFGRRRKELLFVWAQDMCTRTGLKDPTNSRKDVYLKDLSVVWADEKGRGFDQFNTLLIDDTPYKALKNPCNTAIHPTPWTADETEDYGLSGLEEWLLGLSTAESVPLYVLKHSIGLPPLSPSSPHWAHFQGIRPWTPPLNRFAVGVGARKDVSGSSIEATPSQVCHPCDTESGPAAPQKVPRKAGTLNSTSDLHPRGLETEFHDDCVREACFNLALLAQAPTLSDSAQADTAAQYYRHNRQIPVEDDHINVRDVFDDLQIETLIESLPIQEHHALN